MAWESEMSSGRKGRVLASFPLVMEIEEERPVLCAGSSGRVFTVVLTATWMDDTPFHR